MTFHIQTHPSNPDTVLASCERLWRTTTASPTGDWAPIFSPPVGNVVHSVVDANLNIYYAGTDRGGVFAGPNGSGWASVFSHPVHLNLTDLALDPHDPNIVYASFATPTTVDRDCGIGGGPERIYRLRRLSAELPDLSMDSEDITADLPQNLCVNALAGDPHLPRTLYAATNKGVYRGRSSLTGGPWTWHPYNDGMPLTDVRDLEVQAVTGHILAATFGRSAFEVEPAALLTVNIDIKPGDSENPINPRSKGKIPVAILSSADFDAPAELDPSTLTFGRTGDEASLAFCDPVGKDVNGDLLPDEVCHFYTLQTGFQPGDTQGILKGRTVENIAIEGHDAVEIVPKSISLPMEDQTPDGDSNGGWIFSLGTAWSDAGGSVHIQFTLADEDQATLCVYDVSGRLVRTLLNGLQSAGPHQVLWNRKNDQGQRLSAGVYFYRLIAGTRSSQKKLVILKG